MMRAQDGPRCSNCNLKCEDTGYVEFAEMIVCLPCDIARTRMGFHPADRATYHPPQRRAS